MKLPAVAIAAAFAGGVALGLHHAVVPHVTSRFFLGLCFAASVVLILAGRALARIESLFPAATISLLSWTLLGFLGACVAEQPRPANHVTSLLEQKGLSLGPLSAGTDSSGVLVLRTDRDRAVHLLTDGQQLEISCFVACPGAGKSTVNAGENTKSEAEPR